MSKIFSRFLEQENVARTLAEIAQNIASFSFDMRTIHLNVGGSDFLSLHEYAQELYEEAEKQYDTFAEMAISFNEPVSAMNVLPGDWNSLSPKSFTIHEAVSLMLERVRALYDRLESFNGDNYGTFVSSVKDSFLEWLDKQNYKLCQMSLGIGEEL
ncbi:MAG: hypothetical protein J6Y78_09480 [Paludibacteraceae bacterium]|nr:hypothetical protein [Paludibacteraceae bacterium]